MKNYQSKAQRPYREFYGKPHVPPQHPTSSQGGSSQSSTITVLFARPHVMGNAEYVEISHRNSTFRVLKLGTALDNVPHVFIKRNALQRFIDFICSPGPSLVVDASHGRSDLEELGLEISELLADYSNREDCDTVLLSPSQIQALTEQ